MKNLDFLKQMSIKKSFEAVVLCKGSTERYEKSDFIDFLTLMSLDS